MTEWIGLIAAFLTTACYVPQALHVVKERKTDGISLLAYSALFTGVALWFIYGILLGDMPLLLANGVSLPLIATVIVMKMRAR